MDFHNQSVTHKLTIAFSVLIAILIGVSVLSIRHLGAAQSEFQKFVSDEFSRGSLARDVRAAASARAIAARNLILLTGEEDIRAETVAVKAAHDRVQERMAMLKRALGESSETPAEERDLFEKLMKDEEHHIDFLESQLDLVAQLGVQLYAQHHIGKLDGDGDH